MAYQDQLMYLRNKFDTEKAQAVEEQKPVSRWATIDETALAQETGIQAPQQAQWGAVDAPTYTKRDPRHTEMGKQRFNQFVKDFEDSPLVNKYGPQILPMVEGLMDEVNSGNLSQDQAVQVLMKYVDDNVKEFDDDVVEDVNGFADDLEEDE